MLGQKPLGREGLPSLRSCWSCPADVRLSRERPLAGTERHRCVHRDLVWWRVVCTFYVEAWTRVPAQGVSAKSTTRQPISRRPITADGADRNSIVSTFERSFRCSLRTLRPRRRNRDQGRQSYVHSSARDPMPTTRPRLVHHRTVDAVEIWLVPSFLDPYVLRT